MSHTDHSWRHVPRDRGGTDPLGPWDATENVGDSYGVRSKKPDLTPETEGLVLTSTGAGGSIWSVVETVGSGAFETYADAILATPSLWGYWPLSDASGNFAEAVAGRDMVPIEDAPTYVFSYGEPGPFPEIPATTSIGFEGNDSNIIDDQGTSASYGLSAPEATAVFGTAEPFTIMLLHYPTVTDNGFLVNLGDASTLTWALYLDTSFDYVFSRGALSLNPSYSPTLNAWEHVAVTYDGTTARLYVAGAEIANGLSGSVTAKQILQLGRQTSTGSASQYYDGRIAQVALFTEALTADEVAALAPLVAVGSNAPAGYVLTSDGAGGTTYEAPTVEVSY